MAYLFGDASAPSAGKMSGMLAMNRCPTVAEAIEILEAGVPESQRKASVENIVLNGDFQSWASSTNLNSWTEGSQVAASVSQITGGDQYLGTYSIQFEGDGNPASTVNNVIMQDKFSLSDLGRKVRYTVAARRTSGTGDLYVGQGSDQYSTISDAWSDLDDTWRLFVIEKTLTDLSNAQRRQVQFSGEAGSTFQIGYYKTEFLGVTADLGPSSLQLSPGLWLDESGNGKHPVLPDGMRIGEAKTEGVLFAENEFTASAVGQPICADVTVLPADCQVALMMKASVSGDFNIGDGADPDRYAAGVTIGTEWAPVSLLKHTHDGTNRKIVVTPVASYSGVVSTKVRVGKLFSG